VNWAYENNKRRVRRRRGNLLRGRRNQQLEGVCHLLEYGYQHLQFCKMPSFCIPVLLNESSPPFSWDDLLQVRDGWESELQREGGTECLWIWVFIWIRRVGWFVDMGFYTSFLSKLCRFYTSAATLRLMDPSFNFFSHPFCNCLFLLPRFFFKFYLFILLYLHDLKSNNSF